MRPLDGDMVVGLIGICMALFLVSRSGALQRLGSERKWLYGAAWAIIIGVVAVAAARFQA